MDIRKYLFDKEMTVRAFSRVLNVSDVKIHHIKARRRSAPLLDAVKIVIHTGGKINYSDLLSKEEEKELNEWLSNQPIED